jgi:hypothetical protein
MLSNCCGPGVTALVKGIEYLIHLAAKAVDRVRDKAAGLIDRRKWARPSSDRASAFAGQSG